MLLFFQNLWDLFVDMSFYLVIGIIFTGVLHAFVKKSFILKHIGGNSFGAVVKASVVGVPLPLCSCGVVPMALYLGKNGASKGATVSFLTSTPQTGIDSIIATYGMLGGFFAMFRAVVAFISGIVAGCVTNLFCRKDKDKLSDNIKSTKSSCGCCASEVEKSEEHCCCGHEEPKIEEHCCCGHEEPKVEENCCCGHKENLVEEEKTNTCSCCADLEEKPTCSCTSGITKEQPKKRFIQKIASIFTYGFGGFLDEIAVNFVVGIVIASLITTLVPTEVFTYFSNPLLQMLLMLVVGIPMYVCSTASIPIAVALVLKGISPGAAFVFLFAGPVTNIASLTMLNKNLGKKIMAIYLSSVAVCSVAFGFLLDFIINISNYSGIDNMLSHVHGSQEPVYRIVVAIIFGILVLFSLGKRFYKKIKNNPKK